MTFASPNWAWCLFILPVLALFKIAADAQARQVTHVFASSERLRNTLQEGASLIRSGVRFGLQLLGLGFLILTLTRPQVGDEERHIEQTGRNILIAIDCSKSMLATDVTPNRLTRAKLAAQDLLEKLPGDRVGLIAFAGRAFLQAPLTTDHEAVVESIQALDHTTIPRGGSSLASAIALALQSLEQMPGKQHGLIVFTDGQETDNAMLQTAQRAREKGLLVLPVGVGTAEGEMIPDPDPQRQGEYVRDEKGNVIKSRLESAALQELAHLSGTEYVELNSRALTQTLVDRLLSDLERHRDSARQITRPIDRYQWPLFAGIMCLMMSLLVHPSTRRPVRTAPLPVDPQSTVPEAPVLPGPRPAVATVAALALLGLCVPMGMGATRGELSTARRSYDEGRFETSRDTYRRLAQPSKSAEHADEAAYGLGASDLKLKDYDAADRAFSDAMKSTDADVRRRAQRGLATSLYEKGDDILAKQPERTIKAWTDSRDHFDSAMHAAPQGTPEYAELKENRDFVQKRLDELKREQEQKQQQQQQQQQDKKQGQSSGKEQQQEGGGQPQEKKEGGEQKTDAMQKQQDVPEGEIRAGEAGKPDNQMQAGNDDDTKRNDKTGFSPEEARSQLRNYADDQKSVQYLMRDEQPLGGKDY